MADSRIKKHIVDNPDLIETWNWDKNNSLGLDPHELTLGSGIKAWWKCSYGHEWQAQIGSRNNGFGCPYCGGKMLIPGTNDLQTVNPSLAKEWNFSKNETLSPDSVAVGSEKKVWWICEKGHEWQASVGHRNRGTGCPVCAGKQILIGYNDFATLHPDIAIEWNYSKNDDLLPSSFTENSHRRIWWKCRVCGNEWDSPVSARTRGYGCPKCGRERSKESRRKTMLNKQGTLSDKNPILSKEWDCQKNQGLSPADFTPNSYEKVWWKCSVCSYEWEAQIKKRNSGSGCPQCAKNKRKANKKANEEIEQCLVKARNQTSFPEQAIFFYIKKKHPDAVNGYTDLFDNGMELDIFIPSQKLAIEYDGIAWHKTELTYKRELIKYQICKSNGITLIRIKENPQHTEGDTCDILLFCKSSIDETINQLRQYVDLPSAIQTESDRIAIEENYFSEIKQNSLCNRFPALASEWHPEKNGKLLPEMFMPYSGQKVWWKCANGHEWQAAIHSRSEGAGCPICSGRVAIKGFNDLAETLPDLAKEWLFEKNDGLLPDMVLPGSNRFVWWKCSNCGLEWRARVKDRTEGKRCPHCKNTPMR